MNIENTILKLGIIGGGQISSKLCETASNFNIEVHVLDSNPSCIASGVADKVHTGKTTHVATVVAFGKQMDLITCENLNTPLEALKQLQIEGIKVAPEADGLEILNDRGFQKKHFNLHSLNTMAFNDYANSPEIQIAVERKRMKLPFIQKAKQKKHSMQTCKTIKLRNQIGDLLEGASITEAICDIETEFNVLISSHERGQINSLNIDSPKELSEEQTQKAFKISNTLIKSLEYQGALRVNFFLAKNGQIYINKAKMDIAENTESHLKAILGIPNS
jgi:5-(carboxyamino)imidazole ribonucleotide synthase